MFLDGNRATHYLDNETREIPKGLQTMSKEIRVNDLVMVIRSTCCPFKLGSPAIVHEIRTSWTGDWKCPICAKVYPMGLMARLPELTRNPMNYRLGWYPLSELIRIDPPALSEDTHTDEELIA